MLLEHLNLVAAEASGEIVLKLERETAVRALLKGRDVLAVLLTGYGPKKRDFVTVKEDFIKALHHFTREFQGSVNIPSME